MGGRVRTRLLHRTQQRGAETRQRILEAALQAFANHGYEGAMTRDIAAAAGVHQPVINYYFGGKEGLWRAAVDFVFAELRDTFAARLREDGREDPLQTMRSLLRDFVLFNARHPEFPRVMLNVAAAPSARLDWIAERHLRPLHDRVVELIQTIRMSGRWKNIPVENFYHIINGAAASIFVMAPAVVLTSRMNPLSEKNSATHADAIVDLFFPDWRASAVRTRSAAARAQTRRSRTARASRDRRRNV